MHPSKKFKSDPEADPFADEDEWDDDIISFVDEDVPSASQLTQAIKQPSIPEDTSHTYSFKFKKPSTVKPNSIVPARQTAPVNDRVLFQKPSSYNGVTTKLPPPKDTTILTALNQNGSTQSEYASLQKQVSSQLRGGECGINLLGFRSAKHAKLNFVGQFIIKLFLNKSTQEEYAFRLQLGLGRFQPRHFSMSCLENQHSIL